MSIDPKMLAWFTGGEAVVGGGCGCASCGCAGRSPGDAHRARRSTDRRASVVGVQSAPWRSPAPHGQTLTATSLGGIGLVYWLNVLGDSELPEPEDDPGPRPGGPKADPVPRLPLIDLVDLFLGARGGGGGGGHTGGDSGEQETEYADWWECIEATGDQEFCAENYDPFP